MTSAVSVRTVLGVLLFIGLLSVTWSGTTYGLFDDTNSAGDSIIADSNFNQGGGGNNGPCTGGTNAYASVSGPSSISEGKTALYEGDGCAKNEDNPDISWEVTEGGEYGTLEVASYDPYQATFNSTDVSQNENVTIELTVCRKENQCTSDDVTTTITNEN